MRRSAARAILAALVVAAAAACTNPTGPSKSVQPKASLAAEAIGTGGGH